MRGDCLLFYSSSRSGTRTIVWEWTGCARIHSYSDTSRRFVHSLNHSALIKSLETRKFTGVFQLVLVGNNRIELEHIPVEIKDDGKYKVLKMISLLITN